MASTAALDWRSGKNVLMCNKYMLEKHINSDISLVVGKAQTIIPAHKYVLSSRSSVFCSKLSSTHPMTQLYVNDVEPDIFQILLHYMYYENVNIAQEKTLDTMTAAMKYEIHGLVDHCIGNVNSRKTPENICVILKFVYRHPESGIKNSALDYFFENAHASMRSDAFKDLSATCVKELVQSARLNLPPEEVYENLMHWAAAECERTGIPMNEGNKRKVLEPDIFKSIKFENMDITYFATISSTGLLSDTEKVGIFQKITMQAAAASASPTTVSNPPTQSMRQSSSSETLPKSAQENAAPEGNLSRSVLSSSDAFGGEPSRGASTNRPRVLPPRTTGAFPVANDTPIHPGLTSGPCANIQRFQGVLSGKSYMRENHDGISLMISHKVKLHGIYLYGSHQTSGRYKVTLKVLEDVHSPEGTTLTNARPIKYIPSKQLDTDGIQKQYLFPIEPPVILKPEVLYTLDVLMQGPVSFYGRTGKEYVEDATTGVSVTFIPYEVALGGTNTDIGQIPGIQIEVCET